MEQNHNKTENHAATVDNENTNKGRGCHKRSPLKRFVIGILAVVGIVTISSAITGCSMNKWKDADVSEKVEYISERLLKTVDASDQQSADIKAIIEKYEPSLTSINANHQDHKATIIDIFKQEQVSETDLEFERQAIIELLNKNSIELTKMTAEIANVLTVEQRMILIEKMNKRHHRF